MTPMAKIFPREFLELPLRVHSFLRDVPLHDVWVIDLPGGREGITLQEFRSRSRAERTEDIPYATKALLQLRFLLGRIFRLDTLRPGEKSASYVRLLNEADRAGSMVPPGSKDGLFDVVYVFQNEMLLEIINATVHAFSAQTLTRTSTGYRLYWAIYVKPVRWITPAYMALIAPFRRWIVYPQILDKIREQWIRLYAEPLVAPE
jgi:Protein of unknown function (DUF2867)